MCSALGHRELGWAVGHSKAVISQSHSHRHAALPAPAAGRSITSAVLLSFLCVRHQGRSTAGHAWRGLKLQEMGQHAPGLSIAGLLSSLSKASAQPAGDAQSKRIHLVVKDYIQSRTGALAEHESCCPKTQGKDQVVTAPPCKRKTGNG